MLVFEIKMDYLNYVMCKGVVSVKLSNENIFTS
jgi:hypothetical protein